MRFVSMRASPFVFGRQMAKNRVISQLCCLERHLSTFVRSNKASNNSKFKEIGTDFDKFDITVMVYK